MSYARQLKQEQTERRRKDRLTLSTQIVTLIGLPLLTIIIGPLIVGGALSFWGVFDQLRIDVALIKAEVEAHSRQLDELAKRR